MKRLPQSAFIALCALLLAHTSVYAFNFGQLYSGTRSGEPLNAAIDLYLSPTEQSQTLTVSLAPDLFAADQASNRATLSNLTAEVVRASDGSSFIRVQSTQSVNQSVVSFRLRLTNGATTLVRNFNVNILPARVVRKVNAPVRTVRASTTSSTPKAVVGSGATSYGPVQPGDTLWAIARQLRGNVNLESTMQQLFEANPRAFANNDRNRLKVGVTLQLTGATVASTTAHTVAPKPTIKNPTVAQTDSADSRIDAFDELLGETSEEVVPAAEAKSPTELTDDSNIARARDPEITALLQNLDDKFAAIRAQYDTSATTPARTSIVEVPSVADTPEAAAPATPEVSESVTLAPVSKISAATPEPVSVEVPVASNSLKPETSALGIALATLPLLLGIGIGTFFFWRSRQATRERLRLQREFQEASRKADVSRKAERRALLDSAVKDVTETVKFAPPRVDLATTIERLDASLNPTPAADLFEVVGEDEIDTSIAHGRYQDAERALLDVIEKAPRNVQAKLRLAEVYYITERVTEFSALAEDLHQQHRAELTNEEWRRVMRMGKIIAPNTALFAGPRAVGQ